jgi:hypothetical protein
MKYALFALLITLSACKDNVVVEPTPTPNASATPVSTASPTPNGKDWFKTDTGVDLRACDTQIESQNTPWCTAFGFASILANMVCNHTRLSIHHVWSFYQQYSVDAAANNAVKQKITVWDQWPESSRNPKTGYMDFAKHSLDGMKYIDAEDDIAHVLKVLDSGRPVYIGFSVPSDMASCYPIIRKTTKVSNGGHAVAIVGYGKDEKVGGGAYFIIKQSWGTECGDDGYQYMPVSVCLLDAMYCEFYEPTSVK